MTSTISIPILLTLAAFVGILLGLLLSILFKGESKASTEQNSLPKEYAEKGYAEAARLYYSPAEKKMLTFLDGDVYPDYEALTPEQKRRTTRLIQSLNEWGGLQTGVGPLGTVAKEQTFTEVQSEKEPISPEPVFTAAPPPPLPENHVEEAPEESDQKTPAPAAKSEKPKTIVEQIDEIVQEIAFASGQDKRGIRLVDDGHQGVIVWVGVEKFLGVDQVPYPDVQELIRTAVARWEESAVKLPK